MDKMQERKVDNYVVDNTNPIGSGQTIDVKKCPQCGYTTECTCGMDMGEDSREDMSEMD